MNFLGKLNLVQKVGSSKNLTEANPRKTTFDLKDWEFKKLRIQLIEIPLY